MTEHQYTTMPEYPGILWNDLEEFASIADLEPGDTYYVRTLTYGPWVKEEFTP